MVCAEINETPSPAMTACLIVSFDPHFDGVFWVTHSGFVEEMLTNGVGARTRRWSED
jgi:hypothetical protein